MRNRSALGQKGYTLVEVLMVLVILTGMIGMAGPSVLRVYQRQELDTAARELAVEVRSQQVSAWAHQDVHEMWLSRFVPQYRLYEQGRFLGERRLPERVEYRNGYLEAGVSVLRFDQSGMKAGGGVIRLVNGQREGADVRVLVGSGHVVYDGVYR
jgi:prepilin-type N-terminal cleavage/methylation domain-containing protein